MQVNCDSANQTANETLQRSTCARQAWAAMMTVGWFVLHSLISPNGVKWQKIKTTNIETHKIFVGQKLRKNKIQQRVSPFRNTLRASEAASTLPGNGENVEKRKEGREEEKKGWGWRSRGAGGCMGWRKMAWVYAQGVSYGRNFLTLSGALTVCPGGHINSVSLNKVL